MAIATPPLARRKKVLGAVAESTSGTAAAVSAALGGMNVTDARMVPEGIYESVRQPQGHYFGTVDRTKGAQRGRCTFSWELTYADALLTLLPACGWPVAGAVATPSSTISAQNTLTMALWEDGRKKLLRGCSGNITIEGTNGQRVTGSGDFQGVWYTDPTDSAMPALAPINTAPWRASTMTLTIGGAAIPLVSRFNLNLNAQVEPREDVTNATALLHYIVTDYNPTLELDPEARLVAGHDAYGLFLAGTTGAVSIVLTDGTNTLTMACARGQRINIEDADRDGKLTDPITVELQNSSGNDSIVFTKA